VASSSPSIAKLVQALAPVAGERAGRVRGDQVGVNARTHAATPGG
jgi:hypothetical protein